MPAGPFRPTSRRVGGTPHRPIRLGAWALAAVLAVVSYFLIVAPATSAQSADSVTVSQVLANPSTYFGQSVTIRGDVSAVLGPHSFTLLGTTPDVMGGLLVVESADRTDASPYPSQRVEVMGTVREFHLPDIEAAVGVDLDDSRFTAWEGKPVLVAETVNRVSRRGPDYVAGVDELTDYPLQYYGTDGTIVGEVARVISPRAFELREPNSPADVVVLVVMAGSAVQTNDPVATADLQMGELVRVTGRIRPFSVAGFEQAIGSNLDDGTYTIWEGSPAIVARSIERGAANPPREPM